MEIIYGNRNEKCDRLSSVVELQVYFKYQPEFSKNGKGEVHIENV